MSRMPTSLGDKRVVVVVLTLLTVIIAVNLRTFAPSLLQRETSRAADPDEMPVPDDLEAVKRAAAAQLGAGGSVWVTDGEALAADSIERDPFRSPPAVKVGTPPTRRSTTVQRAPVKRTTKYFLNAILLGGDKPTAMINGITRHPGDHLGPYTVESITEEAVVLVSISDRLVLSIANPASSGRNKP